MLELVEMMVRSLVDDEDAVELTEVNSRNTCILECRVAKSDLGKVIGKCGIHASAIRTIIAAVGAKHGKRYIFDLIED